MRFALLLFLVSVNALAQPAAKIETLDWMSGTWLSESARAKVAETWLGPGNGLMVAANLTTFGGGRRSFEFLRIAETPEGLSYLASPGGRPPVEFKLKELGERRVVFENVAHDFPQRILYWREGEALVARVEGKVKGEEKAEQWRFERR
ncbi:MAG TPA: DUF6265 family protein [Usitatibacter sp.]|nr:DUF6265 family protein [Usitatibacter sp.]